LASISPSTFFAVHGVDEAGRGALVRPSFARDKLVELVAAGLGLVAGAGMALAPRGG
jgi:hypothetical protein